LLKAVRRAFREVSSRVALGVGQPAQRLLDVGGGPQGGGGDHARRPDAVGGQVGPAQRDSHGEDAALAELAFGPDLAAVQAGQFLDQGQADAGALLGSASHPGDPLEPLEEQGHLIRLHAGAGVPHRQDRLAIHAP